MTSQDAFQRVDSLDTASIARFITRLEQRGADPTFSEWRNALFDYLDLPTAETVLDTGRGTGVVARAIARRSDVHGQVIGIDQSESLLQAASEFAAAERVTEQVKFQFGDGGQLEFPGDSFERILDHTTISHVPDPWAMLLELARVIKGNGIAALFDGDNASWTFDYPDSQTGKQMDEALCNAVVANPRVMGGPEA